MSDEDTATGAPVELDESELRAWGRILGDVVMRHSVFAALTGPLGAGKTTLVRAACEAVGAGDDATSPSYTLVQRYDAGDRQIYHVDLYRIEDPGELVELGWDDLTAGEHPVWVEWSDRAEGRLPADRWEISLSISRGGRTRLVDVCARGAAPPVPAPGNRP